MGIIKRILLLIFGFLSGLFGFLSLVVSIALTIMPFTDTFRKNMHKADMRAHLRIYLIVFLTLICEILLAFGIAASLLSLRCIFGPRNWIIRVTDYFWKRAVKLAMIMPFFAFGFAGIVWLVDLFIS